MNFEEYDAIVTSINPKDPPGYIRVACVGILGDEEAELPNPIAPMFDWGWFYMPDIGETVQIKCRPMV